MDRSPTLTSYNPARLFALLLSVCILLCYSNSFYADWHLDDYNDIVYNTQIRISDFTFKSIKQSMHADSATNRPIPYMTFALNWYFGKDNIFGYHLVNTTIHIFTAIFLFFTVKILFFTPNLKNKYSYDHYFIAFAVALLWAMNPIQTQAVTYIVQRSAAMAALFYIIAIYFYLSARISVRTKKSVLFFLGCIVSFCLALASKENAAILPIIIILIEFLFFQDLSHPKVRKAIYLVIIAITILAIGLGYFLFFNGNALNLLDGYRYRDFTLIQRLLTESRILIFYLSQIFYPIAARLSLFHNIHLSTSLLSPWTTFTSICCILLLLMGAIILARRKPLISFAILFYFANHLIESSVIPLQLIFEHRNYLPSLFIFLPVVIAINKLMNFYAQKNQFMHSIIMIAFGSLAIFVGAGTYVRNTAWATQNSLMIDARQKSPFSHEPYHTLAVNALQRGEVDKGLALMKQSLRYADSRDDNLTEKYYNLGRIYYKEKSNTEKAVACLKKSLAYYSGNDQARYLLSHIYINQKKYENALNHVNILLKRNKTAIPYLELKTEIMLDLKKPEAAIESLKSCLMLQPNNWRHYCKIGLIFTNTQQFRRGFWFLRQAREINDKSPLIKLAVTYNRAKAGQTQQAKIFASDFLESIPIENIDAYLKETDKEMNKFLNVQILYPLLYELVYHKIDHTIGELKHMQ